jgi:hypothetical protein
VGSVGITRNSSGKAMGFMPRERKRPQIIKKIFFLGDQQKEGRNLLGGHNFLG